MTESPTILYLDLNHWIELSKARLGRAKCPPAYRDIYPMLQRLVRTGAVVTPLSEVHYAEIRDRIRSVDQRNDLAITMAELSRYAALPPREQVVQRQLRAAIGRHFGVVGPASERGGPALGHGVGYARRGKPLDGRLMGTPTPDANPGEILGQVLEEIESWVGDGWQFSGRDRFCDTEWRDALTALFNEAAEFMFLRGPRPSEVEELRALGYSPEDLAQVMKDATEREQRMKSVLMAKAANERRPADVTGAAALALDEGPRLIARALGDLGIPYAAWGGLGRTELSSIVSDTPVLDIERSLRVGRLKSGDYSITGNDLYDMAALGVAVASCDVVATDSSARHMLLSGGVQSRYRCNVVSKAPDLLAVVTALDGPSP